MTEEEKKATIELNHFSNITAYWKKQEYTNSEINNYIKIVLNLIEKQQKEIVKLKKDYSDMLLQENTISKDKIREKIENFKVIRDTILEHEAEYKRPMMTYDLIRNDYCEKMLQELLED